MKRIYCISGLGADHRIFKKLSIDNYELIPVLWVSYNLDDSMESYARKLMPQIEDDDPVIIGLSFGGMLAVEIARQRSVKKVFSVSSAKTAAELNLPGGGFARWVINAGLIPESILTIPNFVAMNYLGATTSEEKLLLQAIISEADGKFMKWALKAIVNWKNNVVPPGVNQIHGTADKIIAPAHVHPDYWIHGGSHILVFNRAAEVSKIISDCLRQTDIID